MHASRARQNRPPRASSPPAPACAPARPRSRSLPGLQLATEMAALWRARRKLDFRYRHDPWDPAWSDEDEDSEHWGDVQEGNLSWHGGSQDLSYLEVDSSWDWSSDSE